MIINSLSGGLIGSMKSVVVVVVVKVGNISVVISNDSWKIRSLTRVLLFTGYSKAISD